MFSCSSQFWKKQAFCDRFGMGGPIVCKCLKQHGNTKTKFDNHSDRRAGEQKKNCTSAVFSRLRTGTFRHDSFMNYYDTLRRYHTCNLFCI